eukprot:4763065-Pleurochrysis_carterae.AAC.2
MSSLNKSHDAEDSVCHICGWHFSGCASWHRHDINVAFWTCDIAPCASKTVGRLRLRAFEKRTGVRACRYLVAVCRHNVLDGSWNDSLDLGMFHVENFDNHAIRMQTAVRALAQSTWAWYCGQGYVNILTAKLQ